MDGALTKASQIYIYLVLLSTSNPISKGNVNSETLPGVALYSRPLGARVK